MSRDSVICEEGKCRCVACEKDSADKAGEEGSEVECRDGVCWVARVRRKRLRGSPVEAMAKTRCLHGNQDADQNRLGFGKLDFCGKWDSMPGIIVGDRVTVSGLFVGRRN